MLKKIEKSWDCASKNVKKIIGENWIDNNEKLDNFINYLSKSKEKNVIIGVSGPGASGKSTFANYLCKRCGFKQLINTTTRSPRIGETNGKDYRFVSLKQFQTDKKNEQFVTDVEKNGRGFYGIYKSDLDKTVKEFSRIIVIESPLIIFDLFETVRNDYDNKYEFILLYFLTENPIIENLLKFLRSRNNNINIEDIKVEHGWRQIEEFTSIISISNIKAYVLQGFDPFKLVKMIEEKINA